MMSWALSVDMVWLEHAESAAVCSRKGVQVLVVLPANKQTSSHYRLNDQRMPCDTMRSKTQRSQTSMKKFTITLIASFMVFSAGALLPKSTAQQDAKTISIAGLKDRVTIRRDERGIPYIEAANDDDLYFAQGYVTRAIGCGRWIFCGVTSVASWLRFLEQRVLAEDKRHRTMGLTAVVEESARHLPANLNSAMNAYANGVNAFIDSLTDQTMPPEFRLLQYKPRHWTPADSLCVGKLLAEYLSNSWPADIMRASLAGLPKEKREALLSETSPLDVLVIGSDRDRKEARAGTTHAVCRRSITRFLPNWQGKSKASGNRERCLVWAHLISRLSRPATIGLFQANEPSPASLCWPMIRTYRPQRRGFGIKFN
jgi:hypothetical protein